MTRRSMLVTIGILVVLAGTVGLAMFLLLGFEPEYFRKAALPAGERRTKLSKEFLTEFSELWSALNTEREWNGRFTDEQINSYLEEAFVQSGMIEKLLPEGISEPRLVFEPERMRLAFRYRNGLVNTVVSICLRVWLPRAERNCIALQLECFQAGLVPFSAQWLLERISETARQNGVEVNWYRHDGLPVALVRFQADQARPTIQLKAVQFEQGSITVHGSSDDSRRAGADRPEIHVAAKP